MAEEAPGGGRICSAQHAGFLSTSLRKPFQDPGKILRGMIAPGETVVDLGCGPGFFTLPMAKMVGDDGCVIAVDLQKEMLDTTMARAEREGLSARIRAQQCTSDSIELTDKADFALAFYMVHEVPDVKRFLRQVAAIVKPGGRFFMVEPMFHVSAASFAKTVEIAQSVGFAVVSEPRVFFSRSVLLERKASLEQPLEEGDLQAA